MALYTAHPTFLMPADAGITSWFEATVRSVDAALINGQPRGH
jgi:hypothetical protein